MTENLYQGNQKKKKTNWTCHLNKRAKEIKVPIMENTNKSSVLDQGKIIGSIYWDNIHHPHRLSSLQQCRIKATKMSIHVQHVSEHVVRGWRVLIARPLWMIREYQRWQERPIILDCGFPAVRVLSKFIRLQPWYIEKYRPIKLTKWIGDLIQQESTITMQSLPQSGLQITKNINITVYS